MTCVRVHAVTMSGSVVATKQVIRSGQSQVHKVICRGETYAIKKFCCQACKVDQSCSVCQRNWSKEIAALAFLNACHRRVDKYVLTITNISACEIWYPWQVCDLWEMTTRHRVPEDRALQIMWSIAEALAFCHDMGLSHLDVKPENIMLGSDGVWRLIDFGSCVFAGDTGITATLSFRAPEGFWRNGPHDPMAMDVWAFGVTCMLLFVGYNVWHKVPPEMEDDWKTLVQDSCVFLVDQALWVLGLCLDTDPRQRASMRQVLGY